MPRCANVLYMVLPMVHLIFCLPVLTHTLLYLVGPFVFFFIRIIFWCSNDNKKKEKKSYTLSVEWAGGGN